ncbi:50S ribosomal protein L18 [bacterium]|nr:50S ribosomal protein L18 [bacterium]
MALKQSREQVRSVRHGRIRRQVSGTSERPRLNVFKSHKNYYIQVIDDREGKTLATASTQEADVKKKINSRGNTSAAKEVGSLIAQRSLAKGIKQVVFDRGGNKYHGAVKALADAARESGLEF